MVDAGEDDNSGPSSHKEDLSPETACGWCVRDMQSNIIAATIDPSANDTDTAQEGVRALSLKEGRHGAETAREKAYKVLQSARSLRERDLERRRDQKAASATLARMRRVGNLRRAQTEPVCLQGSVPIGTSSRVSASSVPMMAERTFSAT